MNIAEIVVNAQIFNFKNQRLMLDELPELDIQEQNNDFAAAVFQNLAVDILLTQNKLFNLVQKNYMTSFDFQGRIISCRTIEGLILLKLYALPSLYRQANFSKVVLYETDLLMLLQEYPTDIHPLFIELKKHLPPGDLASLQDVYREIDEKIQQFSRRF